MEIPNDIIKSIIEIISYSYSEECAHYEEITGIDTDDPQYENIENLPDKNHVFYHLRKVDDYLAEHKNG